MSEAPDWLVKGAPHVWRPYCQMKTAPAPLPVARTHGTRIVLEEALRGPAGTRAAPALIGQ